MPDIETTKIAIATLEGSESEAGQNVCDTFVAGGPVKGTWHLTCTFEDDVETGIQIRVGGIKLWFPFESASALSTDIARMLSLVAEQIAMLDQIRDPSARRAVARAANEAAGITASAA